MLDIVAILGTLLGIIFGVGLMLSPLFIIMRHMKKHNKGWNDPLFDKGECAPQTPIEQHKLERSLHRLANISAFMMRLGTINVTQLFVSFVMLIVIVYLDYELIGICTFLLIFHMISFFICGIGSAIVFKVFDVKAYRGGVDVPGIIEATQRAQKATFKNTTARMAGIRYASTEPMTDIVLVAENFVLASGGKIIPTWVYRVINVCCYLIYAAMIIAAIV